MHVLSGNYLSPLVLILGACTGEPVLQVAPHQAVYEPGQQIGFTASVTAQHGAVAMAKPHSWMWHVELMREESQVTIKDEPYIFCGTSLAAILPVYPLVYAAVLLDIADTRGRFEMIPNASSRTYPLHLSPSGPGFMVVAEPLSQNSHSPPVRLPIEPGRYRARVILKLRKSPDAFPPPVFWNPCQGEFAAETSFVVRSDDKPQA